MDRNDRFSRQTGEDTSAHFARLARELWGCVDELKRVAIPELERRLTAFERKLDGFAYDRDRDRAVRAEEEKSTTAWREETRKRLQRVEDQVDAIRLSSGLAKNNKSMLELDLKTMVVVAVAIGAVIYGFFRQGVGQ